MAENISFTQEEEDDKFQATTKQNCLKVNTKLVPYKSFYFFFFSAVGSVLPYLALFYKQQWLSAQQTGILIGIRPLLQMASNSLFGVIADHFNKSKLILLVAIFAWFCSIFSLSLVGKPQGLRACSCLTDHNINNSFNSAINKKESAEGARAQSSSNSTILQNLALHGHRGCGKMPWKLSKGNETTIPVPYFDKNKSANNKSADRLKEIKPFEFGSHESNTSEGINATLSTAMKLQIHQTRLCHEHCSDRDFFIYLFITVLGALASSPAIPFADTATLEALGEDKDYYGKQRQWGALGWGVSSFLLGAAVSTRETKPHCGSAACVKVDYSLCFYAYAALMMTAFVSALFFKFHDRSSHFSTNVLGKVGAFLNMKNIVFLLTTLIFGCSWGLMQTFLLWHLRDLGGTQFLFSLIAATQCISELTTFYYAGHLIKMVGHYRLLHVSLLYSSLRFTLYGVMTNPWLILPVEVFHGVSTTLVWSVAVSFVSLKVGVSTTLQGILTSVHWGLGQGGGSILCGMLVHLFGPRNTFFAFAIIPLVNLVILVIVRKLIHLSSKSSQEIAYTMLDDDDRFIEKTVSTSEEVLLKD